MDTNNNNRPYVLWRRVSTKSQGESGLGIAAQTTIAEYFMHGSPVKTYTDVYSGTKLAECPELALAIRYCKANGYLLVVAKTDRFRNVKEALAVLDEMGEGNVTFCDLPTTDRMVLTIMFAVWEKQAIMGRINTKRGLAEARKMGRVGGRKKGCDTSAGTEASARVRAEAKIKWIAESKAVRYVRRKHAEGWTVAQITAELSKLYDDNAPASDKEINPYGTPRGCRPNISQVGVWIREANPLVPVG